MLLPSSAGFGRGDGRPLLYALDFGVAEELARFGVQKNRVVRDAVVLEDFFQFRPDRIVAFFLFVFGTCVIRHDKSFADFHGVLAVSSCREHGGGDLDIRMAPVNSRFGQPSQADPSEAIASKQFSKMSPPRNAPNTSPPLITKRRASKAL